MGSEVETPVTVSRKGGEFLEERVAVPNMEEICLPVSMVNALMRGWEKWHLQILRAR